MVLAGALLVITGCSSVNVEGLNNMKEQITCNGEQIHENIFLLSFSCTQDMNAALTRAMAEGMSGSEHTWEAAGR